MSSPITAKGETTGINPETTQVIAFLVKDFLSPLTVRSPVTEIICTKVITSAKTILKIVQNALQVSTNNNGSSCTTESSHFDAATIEKYRKIRLSNKVINERIVQQPGAIDLLTSIGFVYDDSTPTTASNIAADKYLIFVPDDDGTNVALASFLCSTIQDELTSHEKQNNKQNKTKKNPSTTNNENQQNEFLSEKERKERRRKALAAKKAQKAERERAISRWNEDKEVRQEIEQRKQWIKNESLKPKSQNSEVSPAIHQIKIRKLSENNESSKLSNAMSSDGNLGNGSDPIQSLQSLRAEAKASWENKHKRTTSVMKDTMDVDDCDNQEADVKMAAEAVEDSKMPSKPSLDVSDVDGTTDVEMNTFKSIEPSNAKDLTHSWEECLENIPRCAPAQNIRESSVLYKKMGGTYNASSSSPKCFKRLFAEFDELKTLLPSDKQCSAWIRFDEETPQYMRALLTAPLPGPSPYAGGVFAFDIYIPDDYPMTSPQVRIITTGKGSVRFGPNLYADGKVCLSLLGTWQGPKWNPQNSSLHQVLVSIQSLMLGVEHPYFLEPGFGGWEAKVKEGDFASVGQTLEGIKVREETKLPAAAWHYEDQIRLGSMRYALLEPLQLAARVGDSVIQESTKFLSPFEHIIKAHFFHNGNATLAAVSEWFNTARPSEQEEKSMKILEKLNNLFPTLQLSLAQVCPPSFAALKSESKPSAAEVETDSKPPAAPKSDLDRLRERMNEAAQNNNFILAGQLQKEIQAAENFENEIMTLKLAIEKAASEGNYIHAGELQTQLQKKEAAMKKRQGVDTYGNNSFQATQPSSQQNDLEDNFEDEEQSDMEEDMEDEDDEYYDYHSEQYNRWGSGQQLGQTMETIPMDTEKEVLKDTVATSNHIGQIASPPINDPCRVRIRLSAPVNETVNEVFDGSDKLSLLYKYVQAQMQEKTNKNSTAPSPRLTQLRGITNNHGSQAVAVHGGAFANPSSEYGFTLVTPHPKREFSLEMYGSKTLKDLGIYPSSTLIVMMCASRGQVKRGILESKLGEAQGDAMDVDGLNYEALQELGEKIGVASPGDGSWKGIDETQLDKISALLSPKDYLLKKSAEESDTKCPICLGQFDGTESDLHLRMLKSCGHTFHSACLMTWLNTKTNCPVCKMSLSSK